MSAESAEKYGQVMTSVLHASLELLDKRDQYTFRHSRWVSDLCVLLCGPIQIEDSLREELRIAGSVHDLGKIAWPDFLFGPNRFPYNSADSPTRYWLDLHPILGARILWQYLGPYLDCSSWLLVVLLHHWKRAEQHYPQNPENEVNSIFGRIPVDEKHLHDALHIAYSVNDPSEVDGNRLRLQLGIIRVADRLHASTSARPHQQIQKTIEDAIDEIKNDVQYHPNAKYCLAKVESEVIFHANRGWQ